MDKLLHTVEASKMAVEMIYADRLPRIGVVACAIYAPTPAVISGYPPTSAASAMEMWNSLATSAVAGDNIGPRTPPMESESSREKKVRFFFHSGQFYVSFVSSWGLLEIRFFVGINGLTSGSLGELEGCGTRTMRSFPSECLREEDDAASNSAEVPGTCFPSVDLDSSTPKPMMMSKL